MEIKINVQEVLYALKGVEQSAGVFEIEAVDIQAGELDTMTVVGEENEGLDNLLSQHVNAVYEMERKLGETVKEYEALDRDLGTKLRST
ncbi:DUF5344 family protein [Bacillus sp. FSL W7-1360]